MAKIKLKHLSDARTPNVVIIIEIPHSAIVGLTSGRYQAFKVRAEELVAMEGPASDKIRKLADMAQIIEGAETNGQEKETNSP